MVRRLECECAERFETKVNSYALFEELKDFFEEEVDKGIFEDVPILKPIQLFDDHGNVVTQWYPEKWYKCKVCGQIWAFEYPDFPAQGNVYKLDANGNYGGLRNDQ